MMELVLSKYEVEPLVPPGPHCPQPVVSYFTFSRLGTVYLPGTHQKGAQMGRPQTCSPKSLLLSPFSWASLQAPSRQPSRSRRTPLLREECTSTILPRPKGCAIHIQILEANCRPSRFGRLPIGAPDPRAPEGSNQSLWPSLSCLCIRAYKGPRYGALSFGQRSKNAHAASSIPRTLTRSPSQHVLWLRPTVGCFEPVQLTIHRHEAR